MLTYRLTTRTVSCDPKDRYLQSYWKKERLYVGDYRWKKPLLTAIAWSFLMCQWESVGASGHQWAPVGISGLRAKWQPWRNSKRPEIGVTVLEVTFPPLCNKKGRWLLTVTPVAVPWLQKQLTGAKAQRHAIAIVGHAIVYRESSCNGPLEWTVVRVQAGKAFLCSQAKTGLYLVP